MISLILFKICHNIWKKHRLNKYRQVIQHKMKQNQSKKRLSWYKLMKRKKKLMKRKKYTSIRISQFQKMKNHKKVNICLKNK